MKTPLTHNDAVDIATAAHGHEAGMGRCLCCADFIAALLAVDVASRAQANTRCLSRFRGEQCFLFAGHGDALDHHRNGSHRWFTQEGEHAGVSSGEGSGS